MLVYVDMEQELSHLPSCENNMNCALAEGQEGDAGAKMAPPRSTNKRVTILRPPGPH